MRFSASASSAMEAMTATKFGTKVAYGFIGLAWCPNFEYTHGAEIARDTTLADEK